MAKSLQETSLYQIEHTFLPGKWVKMGSKSASTFIYLLLDKYNSSIFPFVTLVWLLQTPSAMNGFELSSPNVGVDLLGLFAQKGC